jgi:hypothetical protein
MSIHQRLQLAYDPAFFFEWVTGYSADGWLQSLCKAVAHAAFNLNAEPRKFHLAAARQSGKTELTASLAAWLAAYGRVGETAALVGPAERQALYLLGKAKKHLRQLPSGEAEITRENEGEVALSNGSNIVAVPQNPDGIRCLTCACIVADEAARCSPEVWPALFPMISVSRGLAILLSTPAGRENLFGQLDRDRPDDFFFTKVTVADNPRMTQAELDSQRLVLGSARFKAEFEVDYEGGLDGMFFDPETLARARASFPTLD